MIPRAIILFVWTSCFIASTCAGEDVMSEQSAVNFVREFCLDCHAGDDAEAGLNLEIFDSAGSVTGEIERWDKIADRVRNREMPPADAESPSDQARLSFVRWIRTTIYAALCDDGVHPAGPMVRRLNRSEYANTLRDLLGIQVNVANALPDDGAGGEGFDNAAETLFISPIHAEKYLDAARSALGHALKDPQNRRRILVAQPSEDQSPADAARQVLANFLPRAFRRPATTEEIDQYLALFDAGTSEDPSFDAAISLCLEAVLVSPKFLFLWEQPNETDQPILISQYEMASRLSYFLWSSMPDSELMSLAEQGKLHDEQTLREQVARMLYSKVDEGGLRRGAKVRDFSEAFTEQWLGTRALGREFKPNEAIVGRFDSELQGGMKYEPIFFFEDLLSENRSLLNLIDSDFTYLNSRLARHYGVKGQFREQPKRVELSEDSHRGGLLGMGAVLAVSSFPHRTSPVLRGKWILETLLGTPPPPPPPGVSEIEESTDSDQPISLRKRLEKHREDASCASCHNTMDPLGFGLENFDVLGRWREEVDGLEIDASGELPDGTTFVGPEPLKELLLERKQQFIRHLTSKMLGYALARGLTNEDVCAVEAITSSLAEDDYKSQTLVMEIVNSVPFRYKKGQNSPTIPIPTQPSQR